MIVVALTFPEDIKQSLLNDITISPNGKRYVNHRGLVFEYIGMSRLNGDIIVKIGDLIFGHVESRKDHYQIRDIRIIPELNDRLLYNPVIKRKTKRIFSEIDPYGEENWEI